MAVSVMILRTFFVELIVCLTIFQAVSGIVDQNQEKSKTTYEIHKNNSYYNMDGSR